MKNILYPLGTGTNACYLEEIEDIHSIDHEEFKGE